MNLSRSGMPGVREWFAANLGIVVALPLILMRGSIPVRVLATTLFTAAVCLATAYLVVRYRPRGRSAYPYWVTAAMALLFASCQLARGFYFMTLNGVSNPVMFASAGSVMLLVAATAIMPTLSMSAMMMVHNVLLADARDAANRDYLTGALSRKGFEAIARTRLEEAGRLGLPVSLLIVDLDHFKSINSTS